MAYRSRGLTFEQFCVGDSFETAGRTITETDIVNFAYLSGDWNPLHTNEEIMRTSAFGTRIAHGALGLAVATGLVNQLGIFEGTTIAVLEMVTRFTGVIRMGDTVHVECQVIDKKESKKSDRGIITVSVKLFNQNGEQALDGQWIIMLKRQG